MSINQEIRNKLPPDTVVFDNYAYDNSIIGIAFDDRVIYDFDKMTEELMNDEGWTEEDAIEWIEYNTIRALPYAGEQAPIIMYRIEREDIVRGNEKELDNSFTK